MRRDDEVLWSGLGSDLERTRPQQVGGIGESVPGQIEPV